MIWGYHYFWKHPYLPTMSIEEERSSVTNLWLRLWKWSSPKSCRRSLVSFAIVCLEKKKEVWFINLPGFDSSTCQGCLLKANVLARSEFSTYYKYYNYNYNRWAGFTGVTWGFQMAFSWLINGGDPNHLLTGRWSSKHTNLGIFVPLTCLDLYSWGLTGAPSQSHQKIHRYGVHVVAITGVSRGRGFGEV